MQTSERKNAKRMRKLRKLKTYGPGCYDADKARLLRSLFEQRNDVDYGEAVASREDAERAIGDAQRFVDAVESWLAEKQKGGR